MRVNENKLEILTNFLSKLERLTDKLKYLYKMEFEQKGFISSDIDIDLEKMKNTDGLWIIERVNIQVAFEYEGALDGDDVYTFTRDLKIMCCLLYTSPSPRDRQKSRMPSSA